jgi:hypothetical protein
MKKIKIILIFLSLILIATIFYWLTAKRIDFNFANEGKIICVDHKDWGIASRGDLTCFGIVPIITEPSPTPRLTKDGEIILKID